MLYSLFLVTQDWNMLTPSTFVGLQNLIDLVNDPLVGLSFVNTAYYTFIGVPLQLLLALFFAVILNQNIRGRGIYRTLFYLPAITPAVASAVVWRQIFNTDFGVANNVLRSLGLEPVNWLFNPAVAKNAFILMSLWGIGPQMVIFLAGLQGVPVQLLEAAEIDGADAWNQFCRISMPIISPQVLFNLVIGIIGSFQVFTSSFIMTSGGPQNATLFMVLYIYLNGFKWFKMGYASALAWLLFSVIVVFTVLQFRLSRQWVYYEGEE
jgi:multiple sugar transport system permease protein